MELNKIYTENCLDTMTRMEDNFVDLVVTSPPYDCYSDDTEILTAYGWRYIKDVSINDMVITLNPNTKEIYYQPIIHTYNYEFNGKLINFKNQDIDLCVTENHNMFITNEHGNIIGNKEHKNQLNWLRPAKNINGSGCIPYDGYIWNGVDISDFELPELTCLYNKQIKTFDKKIIPMIWWVRFMGIYLSEGSCRNTKNKSNKIHSYEITIKQKDPIFINIIREVFDNLPFKYNERVDNDMSIFSIIDRQLWEYLYPLGNSHEKYIPNDMKTLSTKYLYDLLLYMFIGDGTKRSNFDKHSFNLDSFISYKSHSDKLKDDVQECLLKIGKISTINKNHLVSNKLYKNIKYVNMNINEIEYQGNVVCVEVKDHNIIYVRRNGKAVWCGNCLRTYNGYTFDFEPIAKELYRVMKTGGVVVWVVGDATIKGSETGTSFRQALFFKEIGFNLYDTMIYEKAGVTPVKGRYYPAFEYMFVFSKGMPKTFNPICDRKNRWRERWGKTRVRRKTDGTMGNEYESKIAPEFGMRRNIWQYTQGGGYGSDDKVAYKHPAIFPEKLAEDHIISWSNEQDLVYDPFMGSGTTAKMAMLNKRNYIGSEISEEYCKIADSRLGSMKQLNEFMEF